MRRVRIPKLKSKPAICVYRFPGNTPPFGIYEKQTRSFVEARCYRAFNRLRCTNNGPAIAPVADNIRKMEADPSMKSKSVIFPEALQTFRQACELPRRHAFNCR